MMAKLSLYVRLFGSLGLVPDKQPGEEIAGDEIVSRPASPQARSFLAYLILHHDRPIPRDRLTGIFWPERSDARARRALSHALWQIRNALGPAASRLITDEDTVSFTLCADDWLDVEAFEEKVGQYISRQANEYTSGQTHLELSVAVDLYRADFLEACYDDWALVERERLRELYLRALERLITLHKRWGDYQRALAYAQCLATADPLREAAHRELMRLYHLLGRSRAALEQFGVLRGLLEDELGVEPAAATTALYHEIIIALEEADAPHLPVAAPPPPMLRDLAHLPFVGRVEERAALLDRLRATVPGHGGMALVEGDAGVGKTRLVEEIIADARWRGFQVGLGKAGPLAKAAPYQLLRDALSPLLTPLRMAQLAELMEPLWLSAVAPLFPAIAQQLPDLPTLPSLDPQEEQRRLWEGLARCIVGLASTTPLLLVLEDLHWADEAILTALPHLAPHLPLSRTLLLLTYRPAEARQRAIVWETLEALDRALPLLRVSLSSFEPSESAALVRRALGVGEMDTPASAFARRLQDETEGNALFLLETLKALLERDKLAPVNDPSSAGWRFPAEDLPLPTPASVQELIGERVTSLPSELRSALELAAVLGEDADFPVLCHTSDTPPAELSEQLGKLKRRGFLKETKTGYRFEHDLVRSGVYDNIGQEQRRELHRRAGEALETIHPDQAETLSLHFNVGGVTEKAVAYRIKAADHAQGLHDYETAIRHYRTALTSLPDSATRWDVLARLEEALGVLGRRDEQDTALNEMLALAEDLRAPLLQAQTRHRQGWLAVLVGESKRALTLLDEASRLARAAGNKNLLGDCLVSAARAWWNIGRTLRCQAVTEEARSLFEKINNQEGLSRVFNMLGNIHLGHTGDFAEALACFEMNRRICRDAGDHYREACALGNIGVTYHVLGSYERSQEALAAAEEVIEQVGDRLWQGIIRLWQASNRYESGHPERARQRAEEALWLCQEIGNRNFEIESWGLLGLIALDWGDYEQARSHFRKAVEVAEAGQCAGDRTYHLSHLALAHLRLGHADEADRLSSEALSALDALGTFDRTKDVCFERYQIVAVTQGEDAARPYLERAYRLLREQASRIGDPELRESFLNEFRINRAILLAHRLGRPPSPVLYRRRWIPRRHPPTGRPLHEDEYVEVTWTIAAPEDAQITGKVARRRHRILRLLREATEQSAAPTVQHLAGALEVSARTIKRDLAALRAAGHDVQTRGSRG